MKENIKFCLLVIGDLGPPGEISLESIASLRPGMNICAMTNDFGRKWLEKTIEKKRLNIDICLHSIPDQLSWVLANEETSDRYSTFGQSKFFRLMYFKWELILQTLVENPVKEIVIFSDLDVLWHPRLNDFIPDFKNGIVQGLIQKDFNRRGELFFCPGIMMWNNTKDAQNVIGEIGSFHKKLLAEDELLPDDKALNAWYHLEENQQKIAPLPETKFVIGHRLYELLLGTSGYSNKKWVAYHANYTNGLAKKETQLRILSLPTNSPRRIFSILIFLSRLLLRKLVNRPS